MRRTASTAPILWRGAGPRLRALWLQPVGCMALQASLGLHFEAYQQLQVSVKKSRGDGSATCLRTFPVKLPIRIFDCSWENGVLRHAVSESVIEVRNLIKENGGGARKL